MSSRRYVYVSTWIYCMVHDDEDHMRYRLVKRPQKPLNNRLWWRKRRMRENGQQETETKLVASLVNKESPRGCTTTSSGVTTSTVTTRLVNSWVVSEWMVWDWRWMWCIDVPNICSISFKHIIHHELTVKTLLIHTYINMDHYFKFKKISWKFIVFKFKFLRTYRNM